MTNPTTMSKWAKKMAEVLPGAPLSIVTKDLPDVSDVLTNFPSVSGSIVSRLTASSNAITRMPAASDILIRMAVSEDTVTRMPSSLETLDPKILDRIFGLLDKPSTVSLALTDPVFLEKLREYHNKDHEKKDHDNKEVQDKKEAFDPPRLWLRFELPPIDMELVEIKGIMSTWLAEKFKPASRRPELCCKFARFIGTDNRKKWLLHMSPRAIVCGLCREKFDDFNRFVKERMQVKQN